jgi:large conductance mechanosensitive channel
MSGFKNFVLKGNLVDMAVGLIIAVAFGSVVTTFTQWLTGLLPKSMDNLFSTEIGSFGNFLNAVIAFLILAAVVYFFVVSPFIRVKDRIFPPDAAPADITLLEEIRDLLKTRA